MSPISHRLLKIIKKGGGVIFLLLIVSCCANACFDVTFDADGGRFEDGERSFILSVSHGSSISETDIPEPIRSGFDFTGWYLDDTCIERFDFATPITGDMTLYAGWEASYRPVIYTVSFDLNLPDGIAETVASRTLSPGSKLGEISDPEVNDEHIPYFKFLKWTDAEGTEYTSESEIDSSITLYANWLSTWNGDVSADTVSAQLDGEVVKIRTAAELAGLAKLVNDGNDFSGKTLYLTNEIDLAGKEWTPIGKGDGAAVGEAGTPFSGTFNGYGHYVKGISVNDSSLIHGGLFGYIRNATVTDINLTGSIADSTYAGLLAASAYYDAAGEYELSGITADATIYGGVVAGGLIGNLSTEADVSMDINNITTSGSGSIKASKWLGGMIGLVINKGNMDFASSANSSVVSAEGTTPSDFDTSAIDLSGMALSGGLIGIASNAG